MHRKVQHGLRDPVDLLVGTVHCTVCMMYFHNRVRVLNHVKYRSSICRLNLKLAGPVITAEHADALDADCREFKRKGMQKGYARTLPARNLAFAFLVPYLFLFLQMGTVLPVSVIPLVSGAIITSCSQFVVCCLPLVYCFGFGSHLHLSCVVSLMCDVGSYFGVRLRRLFYT